jgi:hypothetical protein
MDVEGLVMTGICVTFSDEMNDHVLSCVSGRRHASVGDDVESLIAQDMLRLYRLRAAIDRGEASGVSSRSALDIWRDISQRR